MTANKHTQGEWAIWDYGSCGLHIESKGRIGYGIAEVANTADAEHIVKCVNNFPKLIQELGDAIQMLEVLGEDVSEFKQALEQAEVTNENE